MDDYSVPSVFRSRPVLHADLSVWLSTISCLGKLLFLWVSHSGPGRIAVWQFTAIKADLSVLYCTELTNKKILSLHSQNVPQWSKPELHNANTNLGCLPLMLYRIEEELGDKARFAGQNFRRPIWSARLPWTFVFPSRIHSQTHSSSHARSPRSEGIWNSREKYKVHVCEPRCPTRG